MIAALPLYISAHAIARYQQRVADVPDDQAHAALDCPAVRLAAQIGAPYVKLSGGQRIALVRNRVVTVLPLDQGIWNLSRTCDARRQGHATFTQEELR